MLAPITVREVMQAPVEEIQPGETAREAARRLIGREIGSLVVCDGQRPVGIVTEIDIARVVAEGGDPSRLSVEAVMAAPLVTIDADEPIEAAAASMREHGIKRLPVVEEGTLAGIVTTTDLSNFLPHLVRLGREDEPDESRERTRVRVDTAYERDDWEFEYLGQEKQIDVGDSVRFSKVLSAEDVETFAEVTGDTNRLHLDEEFASASRFGGRIAHGALVVGVISAALARLPGMVIYLSQDVSYLGPVPIGDRVTARCTVVERVGDDRFRLTTAVETDDGETVIDGEAVVISDEIPTDETTDGEEEPAAPVE
jgi:acyl dehydratase/CBS domain-containing protein